MVSKFGDSHEDVHFIPRDEMRLQMERNRRFLNKHKGERCFVLATGPSIREQDLTVLRNERCFAVSEFYKHPHYRLIRPAYYALAPNHPPFTDDDMLRELAEMKQHSENETFFFGISDERVIRASGLVTDWDRVHYLDFSASRRPSRIDITDSLPRPFGAAFLAIWVAVYMGFSEIYLLGCDHDHLWKWDGLTPFTRENYYRHFYEGEPTTGHQPMDVDDQLAATLKARDEYRWVNEVARRHGTRLLNINPRHYLDVIPRVTLETLFQGQ